MYSLIMPEEIYPKPDSEIFQASEYTPPGSSSINFLSTPHHSFNIFWSVNAERIRFGVDFILIFASTFLIFFSLLTTAGYTLCQQIRRERQLAVNLPWAGFAGMDE